MDSMTPGIGKQHEGCDTTERPLSCNIYVAL